AVRIKRRDGSELEIAPVRSQASPLDVQGVDLGLTAEEIVSAIREARASLSEPRSSGARCTRHARLRCGTLRFPRSTVRSLLSALRIEPWDQLADIGNRGRLR